MLDSLCNEDDQATPIKASALYRSKPEPIPKVSKSSEKYVTEFIQSNSPEPPEINRDDEDNSLESDTLITGFKFKNERMKLVGPGNSSYRCFVREMPDEI